MRLLSKRAYVQPRDTIEGYYPAHTPEKMARWKTIGRLLYRAIDSNLDSEKYFNLYTKAWPYKEVDQFKWWFKETPRTELFKGIKHE